MITTHIRYNGYLIKVPQLTFPCPTKGCGRLLVQKEECHQKGMNGQVAHVYDCGVHRYFVPQEADGLRTPTNAHRLRS